MKMVAHVEARKKADEKKQEESVRQESFATELEKYLDKKEANLDSDDDEDREIALQVGHS